MKKSNYIIKRKKKGKKFLRKLTGLFWFWAHKFFSSLAKIDEQCCRNCIQFVQKTELREFCQEIFSVIIFSDFELVFDGLFKKLKFFVGVVKTSIIMSRRTFWEFIFEFVSSLFLFFDFELKVSGCWHKSLATAVITASHISMGKGMVGKLRKLFRASNVECFFLVFRQRKSVVLSNLRSTFYLSSGNFVQVFSPKFFKKRKKCLLLRGNYSLFTTNFRHCCQNSAPRDCR